MERVKAVERSVATGFLIVYSHPRNVIKAVKRSAFGGSFGDICGGCMWRPAASGA